MRHVTASAVAIAAALLLSVAGIASAGSWSEPKLIWDGPYRSPSAVVDEQGHVFVAARGNSGIWLLTNRSGTWQRTRLTRDQGDIHGENPQLARDPWDGSLTVVYTRYTLDCCPSNSDIRFVTNRGGSWSLPATIPGAQAAGSVVVRNGVTAVAARTGIYDESAIAFITNASGHWTRSQIGRLHVGGPQQPSL